MNTDDRERGIVCAIPDLDAPTFVTFNVSSLSKPNVDAFELTEPNAEEFKSIPPAKENDGNTDEGDAASIVFEEAPGNDAFFRSALELRFLCIDIRVRV